MRNAHDPLNISLEIREQMASDARRVAFFFGAGTSMSVGVPGIAELTTQVSAQLTGPSKSRFNTVLKTLPTGSHVEHVLDRLRTYRELIGDSDDKEYDGLKGQAAKELDLAVCQAISRVVRGAALKQTFPHMVFAQWLRALHSGRAWPVEVFTTNYDLLFEQAMEHLGVPFFDGFVGSVAPFFAPESVEAEPGKRDEGIYPPRAWTRLWKLHGSVNWRVQRSGGGGHERITRMSESSSQPGDELAVFPSREKYSQSRKLPFIALQDRLRRCLTSGECLLIIVGYSFSDEHLNEILFQSLRSNPRLAASAFLYEDMPHVMAHGNEHRNLALYGPCKACVGGITASWSEPKKNQGEGWPFWADDTKRFTLGNYTQFVAYLERFIGFSSSLASGDGQKSPVPLEQGKPSDQDATP